jgi:tetratricopeptide (TPR) repeat protein
MYPMSQVVQNQSSTRCRSCSSIADNKDTFLIWFLWDLKSVLDVVLGNVAIPCRVCGQKDGLRPSVLAVSIRVHQIFCLVRGDISGPIGTVEQSFSELFNIANLPPFSIIRTDELSVFQDQVSDCVAKSARLFPYLGRPQANLDAEIGEVWRGLQGEVQTAILACAMGAVRGMRLGDQDQGGASASTEHITASLENWSRESLTRLPLWLVKLNSSKVSFEEILFRLVDTSAFARESASSVIDALNMLRRAIELAGGDSEQPVLRFQVEALQASLCRAADLENPRELEWAKAFLMKEIAGHELPNGVSHLKLSRARLTQTISRKAAWDATAQALGSILVARDKLSFPERTKLMDGLRQAVDAIGYDGLVDEIRRNGIRIGPRGEEVEDRPDDVAETIASVAWTGAFPPDTSVGEILDVGTRKLSWGNDPENIEKLIEILLQRAGDSLFRRADLLSWFGRRMKELDEPSRTLSRIGAEPADWEFSLDPASRMKLWTERSNALRLVRETERALSVAREVLELANESGSQHNRATATMNIGILERESRFLDEAIRTLASAALLFPEHQRGPCLQSLGIALLISGRYVEAAQQFQKARDITGGDQFWTLLAAEAGARFNAGEKEEASRLLRSFANVDSIPLSALVGYAGVFAGVADRDNDQDIATAHNLTNRLNEAANKFIEIKSWLRAGQCVAAAVDIASIFAFAIEEQLWKRAAAIDFASDSAPDPATILELMRIAVVEGDAPRASAMHSILPVSLAQFFGGIQVTAESLQALSPLERHFNRLIRACLQNRISIDTIQTIADLKRNAHARAVQLWREHLVPSEDRFANPLRAENCVPLIGNGFGSFLVLECIEFGLGSVLVSTLVDGNNIQRSIHDSPDYLAELNEAIESRLFGWRNGRRGEPFETLHWSEFCEWLRNLVGERHARGGHVVVIEQGAYSSIPFHIALATDWTCSYASDWTTVVESARSSAVCRRLRRAGLIYVPRSNESKAAISAFENSVRRSREFFKGSGFHLKESIDTEADSTSVRTILSEVDLVKIMCHGQVSKANAEVALLVANDHELPPGHAFAMSTDTGRRFRLGWRELSGLRESASLIFIGACSSGAVQVFGLDERISLFSTLRSTGAQTLVAPRWKIDVELAMPILDDALEACVQGTPLVRAIASAADVAIARGVPIWQARSFAIQGGWL